MAKKKLSEYIIAYFDILGYKNNVINLSELEENELIMKIERSVKKIYKETKIPEEAFSVKVYSFSDNFLIAVKIKNIEFYFSEFAYLVEILQNIQHELTIMHGLFIRGGLIKGQLYAGKNFVYGKGLINAYEIEDKLSVYPRIVVDRQLLNELLSLFPYECSVGDNDFLIIFNDLLAHQYEAYIKYPDPTITIPEDKLSNILKRVSNVKLQKDMDGNYFINYLQQIEYLRYWIENDNGKIDYTENHDIATAYLNLYIIRVLINLYNNNNDIKIAEKYLWCCSHYNIFCIENNYMDTIIDIDELRINANNKEYILELIRNVELIKILEPIKNTDVITEIVSDEISIQNMRKGTAALLVLAVNEIEKFLKNE